MQAPKLNPLNPMLMQAWNKGYKAGQGETSEQFAAFLNERMESLLEIEGIGEKTAWKVQEHFIQRIDGQEG